MREKKLLHEHFHVKWKWNSGENVMWYGNIMLSDRVCGTIVKSYPIKWWCILAWFSKYLNRLRAYFQIGYSSHHISFTIVGISTHIQLTWSKLMTLNGFFFRNWKLRQGSNRNCYFEHTYTISIDFCRHALNNHNDVVKQNSLINDNDGCVLLPRLLLLLTSLSDPKFKIPICSFQFIQHKQFCY